MSAPPTVWDLSAVLRPVRHAERRLRLARAIRVSVTVLLCALAAAIVVIALRKVGLVREHPARIALGVLVAAWAVATVVAYALRLPPRAGAVALDRHHGFADRLSSALEFGAITDGRTAFMDAAIADALEHAPKAQPRRAVPLPIPRELAWSGGLALVLGFMILGFEVRVRETVATARTIEALEVTPDDLDAVREFLHEMEQKQLGDDAKAAVAEFNQLVDDLAQKRLDRTEAFRKLQTLEAKLEGREVAAKDLEEALSKIGEELKKSELTKPAGEALENKNLAEASERLKELAKKLKEKGADIDKTQLERMREALKKASENHESRKAALDKRREELQKELLKQKEKLGDKANEQEKSLLKNKERELERLEREKQEQEKVGRQLDRLDRELSQAAEDLMKELGASAKDLEDSAEDINRMEREKMSEQEKEQLRQRLQELRETLRQQGGKGQMARLQKFQRRARGGSGSQKGGAPEGQEGEQNETGEQGEGDGKPGENGQDGQQGQGQQGQGQGQKGQKGQGQQGETWILGAGGQKILMLSKGSGSGSQSGGSGSDQKGQGAGSESGGPPQGAASGLKGSGTQDTQVAGQDTGQGSSRSEVIQGAAERGFASRGYTKVYREYKTVAEEALNHDDIPGGYRFYVRRYFLLIRPRDNP